MYLKQEKKGWELTGLSRVVHLFFVLSEIFFITNLLDLVGSLTLDCGLYVT